MTPGRIIAVNLLGVVEHPSSGSHPYRVARSGASYVPVGDGGIVLGVDVGDGVFDHAADHVAPGVCLAHADTAARAALTGLSCAGNLAIVRTGSQAGARGVVIGKRGEAGRIIVHLPDDVRRELRPGDQLSVRAEGQGMSLPSHPDLTVMNLSPAMLRRLPVEQSGDTLEVGVRCVLPSSLAGNGIGRPSARWDIDLQLHPDTADRLGAAGLRLGDLVALSDLDARWNIGYRRGWTTVGIVVHGGSPLPGHGPGITPIFTAAPGTMVVHAHDSEHRGVTRDVIEEVRDEQPGAHS
jgi:hypothetical protein